jgi:hypothetical protein
MKFIYLVILLFSFFLTLQNQQKSDYWENAPVNGTHIYTIYFTSQAGYAVSYFNNLFISTDYGTTWQGENSSELSKIKAEELVWSGEIYCSAMKTTDGGNTWVPYTSEMQEHFCRIYLKDPNTGDQAAEEFLNTVSKRILSGIQKEEIEILKNHPQQCTEYYSNKDEGWALGWCLKDFKFIRSSAKTE